MKEIKDNFPKNLENGICNGAEWKIITNNNIYHDCIGFRDLNKKKQFSKNLIYKIWSMTKPVVSLAVLQLVEKEYLSLNDTLDKFIPQFKEIKILKNNAKDISEFYISNNIPTIRQLLLATAVLLIIAVIIFWLLNMKIEKFS